MKNTITVIYEGQWLTVFKAVADALGLKDRQTVLTEKHFWEILHANASHGISLCEHELQTTPN